MDLKALGAAVALMLILEAIGPFANPRGTRKLWRQAADLPDGTLRIMGAIAIVLGLVLLSVVRNG